VRKSQITIYPQQQPRSMQHSMMLYKGKYSRPKALQLSKRFIVKCEKKYSPQTTEWSRHFPSAYLFADALLVAVNSHTCHHRPLRNRRNDIHTVPQPHCTKH